MLSRYFLLILVILGSLTESVSALFQDIDTSWYKDSIMTLANEKVISGYSDGNFGPEKPITRAELLKIILTVSGNGLGEIPQEKCFPDVPVSMWYHGYICRAYALRITNGFQDGTFKPDNTVTTLEALAFGLRAFGLTVPAAENDEAWHDPLRKFADEKKIIPIYSYTLETPLHRGRATELITRMRTYKQTQVPGNYKSNGCQVGHDLSTKNTINIAGVQREYLLTVPRGYLKVKQYPLIIAHHGRTNSNEQVQAYMGINTSPDFIVAYPEGLDAEGSGRSWSESENILFFDTMIRDIADAYCIDRSRISLVGHSLGGWYTQKLACLRGDIIQSTVTVGSAGYSGNCSGPAASLIYQNKDDALSPYSTGISGRDIRRKINQCSDETSIVQMGSVQCLKYEKCATGNPVIWCENYTTYGNDPHSWPLQGGSVILDFLRGLTLGSQK